MNELLNQLPPQSIEIEDIILGALMLEANAITSVADILKPEMFYNRDNQVIYQAIYELNLLREPVDLVTVRHKLQQNGESITPYTITEKTNRVASSANIVYHARIIQQFYLKREVIRICRESIALAYDDSEDSLNLVDRVQTDCHKLLQGMLGREFTMVSDLILPCIVELEKKPDQKSGLTGIATYLSELDDLTGGWQKSDLIIVAARPAMGKTAFVLHCIRAAAIQQSIPVAIFSLEMNALQLTNRMIAAEGTISMSVIKHKTLEDADFMRIHSKIRGLENSKILIDDSPGMNMVQIRAKAMRMKQTHGIGMLFIDYLGLIQPSGRNKNSNRTNDIGEISRSLKELAKELDIPVVVLCQLNRKLEDRPGGSKRPQLSDLRDSGDIEQDADQVIFLHRPEYYGLTEDDNGPTDDKCYLLMAKHRNGDLGMPAVKFKPEFMQFSNFNSAVEDFGKPSNFIIRPSRMQDDDNDYTPF